MSESRATPIRIDIPDVSSAARDAAMIVMDAIAEAGLDNRAAINNQMVRALALDWRDGRSTRAEFINGCRNMAILNPSLKASPR